MNKKILPIFLIMLALIIIPSSFATLDVMITTNATSSNNWQYGSIFVPAIDITQISILGGNKTSVSVVTIFNATGSNTSLTNNIVGNLGFQNFSGEMRADFNNTLILKKGGQYYILVGNNDSTSRPIPFLASGYNVTGTNGNFTNSTFVYSTGSIALYTPAQRWGLLAVNSSAFTQSNFSVTLNDFYTNVSLGNNASITNFTVNISGTYFPTTNGTVYTNIFVNSSQLWTIQVLSNQSGGYFNNTYTGINVSSGSFQAYAVQSIINFNASLKVTGALATNINFSSVNLTNVTQYMFANTSTKYNITAFGTNYINKTQEFNVTNFLNTTYTISNVTNCSINVTVVNLFTGVTVSGVGITISNTTYAYSEYGTTAPNYVFNVTTGVEYTFTTNSSGFLVNTTVLLPTNATHNLTIFITSNNQVYFYFFDEDTLLPVSNVTYFIYGTTYAYNGSTANNSFVNLTGLSNDSYQIRYSQNSYTARSYFFSIPIVNSSFSNTTLYLVNGTRAVNMTVTVTDNNNKPISGLKVSLLRQYAVTSTTQYLIVEQMLPAIALEGTAPFTAIPSVVPYLFRVEDASTGLIYFQGSGVTTNNLETLYLIQNTNGAYAFYIKINPIPSPFRASYQLLGVSDTISNNSNAFSLSYTDTKHVTSSNCFTVIENRTTTVGSSCSSSYGAVIVIPYTQNNGSLYVATYSAVSSADSRSYVIDQSTQDLTGYSNPNWGYWGLAFLIVTQVFLAIGFSDKPDIGLVLSGISITLFGLAALGGLIGLPSATAVTVSGSMMVLSIILAVLIR